MKLLTLGAHPAKHIAADDVPLMTVSSDAALSAIS